MPLAPLKDPWQQVPLLDDLDLANTNNNEHPVGEEPDSSRYDIKYERTIPRHLETGCKVDCLLLTLFWVW